MRWSNKLPWARNGSRSIIPFLSALVAGALNLEVIHCVRGVISPVLANVYLHYVLDLWFERVVRKNNQGRCKLFRFADDFVACFEYRHEAAAFEQALKERLAKFGLELAMDKTKTLRFGRNGGSHNGRFDFLGFEFFWELDAKAS